MTRQYKFNSDSSKGDIRSLNLYQPTYDENNSGNNDSVTSHLSPVTNCHTFSDPPSSGAWHIYNLTDDIVDKATDSIFWTETRASRSCVYTVSREKKNPYRYRNRGSFFPGHGVEAYVVV